MRMPMVRMLLLEFDSGIDEGDDEVGDDVADEHEEGGDGDGAHDDGCVAVDNGLVLEESEALDVEDAFDEHGSADEDGDEAAEAGGDGDHGVAEGVAEDGFFEADAFCDGGADVVCCEVVHEVVFGEHGEVGEATDDVAGEGEDGVADAVLDFSPGVELVEVRAFHAEEGEEVPACAEVDEEDGAEGEAGDGVAEEDEDGAGVIDEGAVFEGFEDAKREADAVGDDGGEEAEVDGDGHALEDHAVDGVVVGGGAAEVALEDAGEACFVDDGAGRVFGEVGVLDGGVATFEALLAVGFGFEADFPAFVGDGIRGSGEEGGLDFHVVAFDMDESAIAAEEDHGGGFSIDGSADGFLAAFDVFAFGDAGVPGPDAEPLAVGEEDGFIEAELLLHFLELFLAEAAL